MKGFTGPEEAVSESLGLILIAGILTFATALVLMIGYPIYVNSIYDGHMQNMEECFYLVATNGNKVAMYESPSQSSELKLYDGTLYTEDAGSIKITVYDASGAIVDETNRLPLAAMAYKLGNTKVSYYMGGVFKKQGDASIILKDPPIYFDDALVVHVIKIKNSARAIGGKGLSRITFTSPYYSKLTQKVSYPSSTVFNGANNRKVEIKITGEYNDALKRYFEDKLQYTVSIDGTGELTATKTYPGAVTVYIVPGDIDVSIN